jgi:hypothetical protein
VLSLIWVSMFVELLFFLIKFGRGCLINGVLVNINVGIRVCGM